MPGFYICKRYKRFWIWLNNALWQGSEYAMSMFRRVLNRLPVLSMPVLRRLGICKGFTGCWICLNKPEYALIMSQYAQICLNNAEYDWICHNILEKTECGVCQNASDAVHSIQITEQLSRQTYSEHCQIFKMELFAKIIIRECRRATRDFLRQVLGGWGGVELVHKDG